MVVNKVWDDERVTDFDLNASINWACLKSLAAAGTSTGFVAPTNAVVASLNDETTGIDTANTKGVWSAASKEIIAGGTIYDNIDDSSVDATLWTTTGTTGTGTVTENTDNINIGGGGSGNDAYLNSNGSGGGLNANSGVTYILIDAELNTGTGSISQIICSNMTTDVVLYGLSNGPDLARTAILIKIDAGADLGNVYARTAAGAWSQVGTDVDISTVTTNKYLRFRADNTGAGGFILYKICYYTTDADSEIVTSAKTVASATKVGGYADVSTVDRVISCSLNGGSGYTTAVKGVATGISSGTSLKGKVTLKTGGGLTPDILTGLAFHTLD